MAVDSPDVLRDFGRDGRQQPAIDWVERVGEDELGPGEDAELVAERVKVVSARELVRWVIDATAPKAKLRKVSS